MSRFTRVLPFLASFALLAAGLAVGLDAATATGAPSFCAVGASYDGQTITWTGKGDGKSWDDADNWDSKTVPDGTQIPTIYQTEYVCIGKGQGGKVPNVQIKGTEAYHVDGVDIGQGAGLTIAPRGGLFVGTAGPSPDGSIVESGSTFTLDAGVLGGNATFEVDGTMHWTGERIAGKKEYATQTSSACVFDPSIKGCPGDLSPGGGLTTIGASGKLLIDGKAFGGAVLGDQRELDNEGSVVFSGSGFVDMNNNTTWIDEKGSTVEFAGDGGIYPGVTEGYSDPGRLNQKGKVLRDGKGMVVVGVATSLAKKVKPKVRSGGLVFGADSSRTAKLARGTEYGVGSCVQVKANLCRQADATKANPQAAYLGTSTDAPKTSKVSLVLSSGPSSVKGHTAIGDQIAVTAPTEKTTHSTHLTFAFDASMSHLTKHPTVLRNGKPITLCASAGLTATNTSCAISEKIGKGGDIKGDLTVVVISIQPNATWTVAS